MKTKIVRSVLSGGLALVATLGMGVGRSAAATRSTLSQSTSGTEDFTVIESSPNGGPIVMRGLFTGAGSVVDNPDGVHSTINLQRGTITIETGDDNPIFNPSTKTCIAHFTDSGDFTVTGGTGAYAALSGGGTFGLSAVYLFPRTAGVCNFDGNPIAQVQIINATGQFSLG